MGFQFDLISTRPTRKPPRNRGDYLSLLGALAVLLIAGFLGLVLWAFSPGEIEEVQPAPRPVIVDETPAPTQALDQPTLKERVRGAVAPVVDLPSLVTNPLDFIPDWPEGQPATFLLLGTDRREGDPFAKTDTIMVLSIDTKTNSAILVSIPRDVCLAKCESEPYRINTVLFLEGPDGLRRRVSDLLGFEVKYHVTMDFPGFVKLVDFFGGVEIDVKRDIEDYRYPNPADDGFDPFILRAGVHRMYGEVALKYVRTRWEDPEGDFGRIHRQQQFLMAMRDQVLTPKLIVQAPAVVGQLGKTFDTNLGLIDIPALAKLSLRIDPAAIMLANIDYTDSRVYPGEGENGAKVLIPNIQKIQQFLAQATEEARAAGKPSTPPIIEPPALQQLEP